ncbi:MAG: hypothetical protein R3310_11155, partial [Candidatus Competibacteraceae bacterium]|nr:hypothetical protein [Candidatus Competibacteraceae bacterium]
GDTDCGASFAFEATADGTLYDEPIGLEMSAIPWQSTFIQGPEDLMYIIPHTPPPPPPPPEIPEPTYRTPLTDLTSAKRMSWREITAD